MSLLQIDKIDKKRNIVYLSTNRFFEHITSRSESWKKVNDELNDRYGKSYENTRNFLKNSLQELLRNPEFIGMFVRVEFKGVGEWELWKNFDHTENGNYIYLWVSEWQTEYHYVMPTSIDILNYSDHRHNYLMKKDKFGKELKEFYNK